jgi:hypothetical protein
MGKIISEERVSRLKEEFFQGFIKTCGINLVSLEQGRAESRLEITGAHSQQDEPATRPFQLLQRIIGSSPWNSRSISSDQPRAMD